MKSIKPQLACRGNIVVLCVDAHRTMRITTAPTAVQRWTEGMRMTNCNDCVHEQTCDQSSRQMWSIMAGELDCTDFKDRQNYVEVVRCKECRHLEITGCYGECKRGYMGIVKPWDFCSYGERREGE